MQTYERIQWYQLVEFLSQVLGPAYSFAFYELEDIMMRRTTFTFGDLSLKQSISCTEYIYRLLQNELDLNQYYELDIGKEDDADFCISAFFLREEDKRINGALAIVDHKAQKMKIVKSLEMLLHVEVADYAPALTTNHTELMNISISNLPRLFQQLLGELNIEANGNLSPNEKSKLIFELRKRGVFKMKGAVTVVAQLLNTSIPTVYRYLSKLDQEHTVGNEIFTESIRLL